MMLKWEQLEVVDIPADKRLKLKIQISYIEAAC
jgi:hypothetical protein